MARGIPWLCKCLIRASAPMGIEEREGGRERESEREGGEREGERGSERESDQRVTHPSIERMQSPKKFYNQWVWFDHD